VLDDLVDDAGIDDAFFDQQRLERLDPRFRSVDHTVSK
jgi:hypothetical protein